MMIAAPTMVAGCGTSPNTMIAEHHGPDDHRILIGHDDARGRKLQRAVNAEKRGDRDAAGCGEQRETATLGVTQPNGDISAPSAKVPTNCVVAITISGVARRLRVISIRNENDRLPPSAIMAGQLTVCAEGRSAIRTPQKPIRIALQRRQPTRSPSTSAESAVTKIGQAR